MSTSKPRPYRSAIDAPIEIRATRGRSREVATWVYPEEVDRATRRLAEQDYTVTSITGRETAR